MTPAVKRLSALVQQLTARTTARARLAALIASVAAVAGLTLALTTPSSSSLPESAFSAQVTRVHVPAAPLTSGALSLRAAKAAHAAGYASSVARKAAHAAHVAHVARLRARSALSPAAALSAPSGPTSGSVPSGGSGGLSGTLSCTGLARLWLAAGGSAAHVLVAAEVAMAESGGNQYAHSPTNDFGYWQINGSHGAMASYDPMTNARAAISVSGDGSNWSPWTTYTSGAYAGKCPAASVSAASRIGVPAPVASAPGSSLEVRAMRLAESKIGDPYVYGAEGPDKFDCSGLVTWAYHQLGATRVGRTTGDLWNEGPHVSRASLQPGDLLFFDSIGHVGIYTGNGQMVVAPHTGDYVKIQAVYWAGYDGAVRIA